MEPEVRKFTKLTVEDENGEFTISVPRTSMFLSEYLRDLVLPALKVAGFQDGSIEHYLDTDQVVNDALDPVAAVRDRVHDENVERKAKETGQITTIIEMGRDAVTVTTFSNVGFEVSIFGHAISKVFADELKANELAEELRQNLDRFGWDYVNVHGGDQ